MQRKRCICGPAGLRDGDMPDRDTRRATRREGEDNEIRNRCAQVKDLWAEPACCGVIEKAVPGLIAMVKNQPMAGEPLPAKDRSLRKGSDL